MGRSEKWVANAAKSGATCECRCGKRFVAHRNGPGRSRAHEQTLVEKMAWRNSSYDSGNWEQMHACVSA